MVEPHSSKFGVITTNFWGVRIFRKFTVLSGVFANLKKRSNNIQFLWYHNIISDIANIIPRIILVKIWKDSITETVRIYCTQNKLCTLDLEWSLSCFSVESEIKLGQNQKHCEILHILAILEDGNAFQIKENHIYGGEVTVTVTRNTMHVSITYPDSFGIII